VNEDESGSVVSKLYVIRLWLSLTEAGPATTTTGTSFTGVTVRVVVATAESRSPSLITQVIERAVELGSWSVLL